MALRFTKMHGAGNDFVVLDAREDAPPDRATLARMADRRFGIGCDQVMLLGPPRSPGAIASYRVINGDGSEARQCGNGARCLAAWLYRDGAFADAAVLDGPTTTVPVRALEHGGFEVALAVPDFDAEAVPVRAATAGREGGWQLSLDDLDLSFGAVSIGNPHVVIVVDDVDSAPVHLAQALQSHAAFPDGCNVGFAQVLAGDHIRLRVVERGVGETLACGSGACAAHAWLCRTGRVGDESRIDLPGGTLAVAWSGAPGEPVRLRGPAQFVFEGTWSS